MFLKPRPLKVILEPSKKNKVSLQTNLERNPTNSSYIFILSVNFEN